MRVLIVVGLIARLRAGFVSPRAGGFSFKVPGRWIAVAAAFAAVTGAPAAEAKGVLQCVPYARSVSGIAIHGDAHLWWGQAAGTYQRGQQPEVGAVLAFRSSAAMPLGHVAVVGRIVDGRHVMLNHANWSRPGMIERSALAEDVSPAGDWSQVRVWFASSHALGQRVNPTYGFIYARAPQRAPESQPLAPPTQLVAADRAPVQLAAADASAPQGLSRLR